VLVAMDVEHRVGRTTRQSLFVPLSLLQQADTTGWAEQPNSAGEQLVAFHPAMLPVYVEMQTSGAQVGPEEIVTVIDAAGFTDDLDEPSADRARKAATRLVRDAKFRSDIVTAYGGVCAMCGFNFSLVSGAHIYPASAPNSLDKVWNGLALCHNHHAAFDKHLLYIEPTSRVIRRHPTLENYAGSNAACHGFVQTTFPVLAEPVAKSARPRDQMLIQRYAFFEGKYTWI
jgi:hypothetical protein